MIAVDNTIPIWGLIATLLPLLVAVIWSLVQNHFKIKVLESKVDLLINKEDKVNVKLNDIIIKQSEQGVLLNVIANNKFGLSENKN